MLIMLCTARGRRLPVMYLLLTFLMVGFWSVGWGQTLTISANSVNFPATAAGTTSVSTRFNLNGTNLKGAPGSIIISSLTPDFQVSADNSTFGSSTSISYSSPTLNTTGFYVRFSPQSPGVKSGTITVNGGSAFTSVSVGGTATAIYYSKSAGSLNVLSTWGTNKDGTGVAPANFTDPGQVFAIQNNPAPTVDSA